jgi:transcriptional regulator EpsA
MMSGRSGLATVMLERIGEDPRPAALHSSHASAAFKHVESEPTRSVPRIADKGKRGAEALALAGHVINIERHSELLAWLRGPVQSVVAHDMLIAAWGNFSHGTVRHDILSCLPGVRSYACGTEGLAFLLVKLHERWVAGDRKPVAMRAFEFDYLQGHTSLPGLFCSAFRGMRSAYVHGLTDHRTGQDCIYAFFSREALVAPSDEAAVQLSSALETVVPFIDAAMRRIPLLPQQCATGLSPAGRLAAPAAAGDDRRNLTERETQIMAWVAMGKTNSEIGSILSISGFTVKNHMQRIFKKLDVFNRAQAVSKITRIAFDG